MADAKGAGGRRAIGERARLRLTTSGARVQRRGPSLAEYDAAVVVKPGCTHRVQCRPAFLPPRDRDLYGFATEENAVVQAIRQVEDARAGAHTATAALALSMGAIGIEGTDAAP